MKFDLLFFLLGWTIASVFTIPALIWYHTRSR